MTNSHIHVARNGQVLEPVPVEKVSDLLAEGVLLPTDHYFDDATSTWVLLSEWKQPPAPNQFRKAQVRDENLTKVTKRNTGQKSAARKQEYFTLGGWIACLFAAGAAAGIWAWAQNLNEELATAQNDLQTLTATNKILKQENFALNEVTPPNRVRSLVTYEPGQDQVAILSGVTVGLYSRAAIEEMLKTADLTTGGFDESVQRFRSSLPSPISVTLSDSNGRVDLPVPDEGDYVLVASASSEGNRKQLLWLAGFHAAGTPSNVLLLAERNAVSRANPKFSVREMRTLSAANPQ